MKRQSGRSQSDRAPTTPSPIKLRRLEPRRVLNASITSLAVPTTAVEGETVEVSAEGSGTAPLEFDWTITHEGTVVEQSSEAMFEFTPEDEGTYEFTLLLTSGPTQTSVMQSSELVVSNVTPALANLTIADAPEGTATKLTGQIVDPGVNDTFTLTVDWGDGTVDSFSRSATEREFDFEHTYVDDDPSGTLFDYTPVVITVTDNSGASSTETRFPPVENVAPVITNLAMTDAGEGSAAQLTGQIVDPGTADTFTLIVDWGDGTVETFSLGATEREIDLSHIYVDDNPTGTPADMPSVTLTVTDDDTGSDSKTLTPTITNVAPVLTNLAVTDASEGSSVQLTGEIVDPGTEDTFTLVVDWGDGTVETFNLSASERDIALSHSYVDDDPTGTPADMPSVTLTVTDDDSGSDSKTLTPTITNVAPVITNLAITNTDEAGSVQLTGEIVDSGAADTFTMVVDWGDGSVETFSLAANERSIDLSHTYIDDDPTGTPADMPSVTLTVTDDDSGSDSKTLTPTITNVAPRLTNLAITDIDEAGSVQLTGEIVDPGTADTFELVVDWGDGTIESFNLAANERSIDLSHVYIDDDPTGTPADMPTVTVTVTDDDTGSDSKSLTPTITNVAPVLTSLAITNADEAGSVQLTGEIVDPGAADTFELIVDWGDGTVETFNLAASERDIDLSHTYVDDDPTGTPADMPSVTVTVTDDDTGSDSKTLTPTITNVAPVLTNLAITNTDEAGLVQLTGEIIDPGTADTFELVVDWGDGTVETFNLAAHERDIDLSHTYIDDNPTGTSSDMPLVTVTVTDDDTGSDSITLTPTVSNVAPILSDLAITDTNEAGSVQLTGQIIDPGTVDTFELVVDWGDGTVETFNLAANERDIDLSHTYVDDDPTGTPNDMPTVTVTVTDDDTGSDTKIVNPTVSNVAPTLNNLVITDTNEAGAVQLTGEIVDPGTADTFELAIDWGDGTVETFNLSTSERDIDLSHTYVDDDPTGTPADMPTVTVTVTDDDTGSDSQTLTPTITNVAPVLTNLAITDANEADSVQLTGEIVDPGTADTFTLVVDWGDGTVETFNLGASERVIDLSHTYIDDDPTGTPADMPTVTVTVTDDDTGSDSKTLNPTISNVAPVLTNLAITDTNEAGSVQLTGEIVDPGTADTFTLVVDWGDGNVETFNLSASERDIDLSHTYVDDDPTGTPADMPTVAVTVTDDDTGSDSKTLNPTISNVAPVIAPIDSASITEGSEVLLTPGGVPKVTFTDVGVVDTHTATVDWGDGSPLESLTVSFLNGSGTIDGSHTYADDGLYTVTITLTDDDTGQAVATFEVEVSNIDPQLTGTDGLMVDEGEGFTLADLGVGVTDPGFDNPLNMGETEEFFLDGVIDWGDGSPTTSVQFVDRTSGSAGTPTVATPEHDPHHYADNGEYTVTITFADDDGSTVDRTFQITVKNVAPSLVLPDPMATINEGDTLFLPNLGTFSDPGFNNPDNPSGATFESFLYTIDWGDGTIESGLTPESVTQGSAGVETTGTLSDSHTYADNDADNTYTITVTVTDDDGDSVTQSVEVTVLNVDPTLEPIMATDVGSNGVTTLDLTFADPGADTFEVLVDWGDKDHLPPEDRFVVERLHAGATPTSFTINHRYFGPPNPLNPTADIIIKVKVRDDDFGTLGVITAGESNLEEIAISNSGIEENQVAIDTTPQAPPLVFPPRPEPTRLLTQVADSSNDQVTSSEGAAASELSIGTERYLELRFVAPNGLEGKGIRLKDATLDHLPALFAILPEGHFRLYVVYTETNTRRLALDFNIRRGNVIDPSDDTDGGRDKPRTEEPNLEVEDQPPAESSPVFDQELPQAPPTPDQASIDSNQADGSLAALALAGVATQTDWATRVQKALARADDDRWRRLFRRRPR